MTYVVGSIAQLRDLAPGAHPEVEVAAYRTPGDGGAGTFHWDPDHVPDLATFPDGEDHGLVIRPAALPPTAPGRWRRRVAGDISVRWFGATGDPGRDDTAAIQHAEDALAARMTFVPPRRLPRWHEPGTPQPTPDAAPDGPVVPDVPGRPSFAILHFPAGTYVVDGAAYPCGDGRRSYGIRKRSQVHWTGEDAGTAVLRLKGGSTQQLLKGPAERPLCDPQMVFSDGVLEDVEFRSLGFDLNGRANPLSPDGPVGANVAALWFDGERLEVRGLVVRDCTFSDGPGASVIVVENRRAAGGQDEPYPLEDVRIENNLFDDNCHDAVITDHSTLNIWARRTVVWNNVFRVPAVLARESVRVGPPDDGADGSPFDIVLNHYRPATAMEFHGDDGLFLRNLLVRYARGVVASENFLEPWRTGLRIADNTAQDLGHVFLVTEVEPGSPAIDNIVVTGNRIAFSPTTAGGGDKAALWQAHRCHVERIELRRNVVELPAPGPLLQAHCLASPAARKDQRQGSTGLLIVDGNTLDGFTIGLHVNNNSSSAPNLDVVGAHYVTVSDIAFTGNICANLGNARESKDPADLGCAVGLHLVATPERAIRARVDGNTFASRTTAPEARRYAVSASVDVKLDVGTNTLTNMTSEVVLHPGPCHF